MKGWSDARSKDEIPLTFLAATAPPPQSPVAGSVGDVIGQEAPATVTGWFVQRRTYAELCDELTSMATCVCRGRSRSTSFTPPISVRWRSDGATVVAENAGARDGAVRDTGTVSTLRGITDGVVAIRRPQPADTAALIHGRDAEFHRFLGEGDPDPRPTGCITAGATVVGWVDYDTDRSWLLPGEVNVGYNVFAEHRGRGYGTRAVQLLMHHLALDTDFHTATLLIDPANSRSRALARRIRCGAPVDFDGNPYFKRPVPPLQYTDGAVTIRRHHVDDLEADLEAKDDEQITWLWLPGEREKWETMPAAEQRDHARRRLQANHDMFGAGPKWTFAVDTASARAVGYVDCDLANDDVPAGEANIAYNAHPAHRGNGYISAAVRLVAQFVRDHTGARTAHIVVDATNRNSLRVADAAGAIATERWIEPTGRTLIRHVIEL